MLALYMLACYVAPNRKRNCGWYISALIERKAMQIWELHLDGLNQYAVLVPCEEHEGLLDLFTADGSPKHWPVMPKVEPFIEKRKKVAKPRADISYLSGGSIILNQKAFLALKDFLLPFGQLLKLDCKGEIEYFYNVTNLLACIDFAHSEKQDDVVIREVFLPQAVPDLPQIFKDPHTARMSIYINQAGREKFEQLAAACGVFGARFVPAGQGDI